MIRPNVVYPDTPFPEGSAMHEVQILLLYNLLARLGCSGLAASQS